MRDVAVWAISAAMVAGIAVRPWRIAEWIWAAAGAAILVGASLLPADAAARAVAGGANVYLFLTGMLLLSRVLEMNGVFDWLASRLLRRAGTSRLLLFWMLYGVGVVVTALLSNDATIVLLTPAVVAAGRRFGDARLPYLYGCAFVSNAASYLLPISNPANLVVFRGLPTIGAWVVAFGLSAVAAVVVTGVMTVAVFRRSFRTPIDPDGGETALRPEGLRALWAVLLAASAVVAASAFGAPVGLTAAAGGIACALLSMVDAPQRAWPAFRSAPWGILPLVAGLFVMVQAIDGTGALDYARLFFRHVSTEPAAGGMLLAGAAVTVADNVMNNLPAGLVVRYTISGAGIAPHIAHAALVGIDLGPNLSITGSLATLLWLMILRADGIRVSLRQFLYVGLPVTLPALAAALLLLR